MGGLRGGSTAGGRGRGHSLIHILSVQYTPFFACFVAWEHVANARLCKPDLETRRLQTRFIIWQSGDSKSCLQNYLSR